MWVTVGISLLSCIVYLPRLTWLYIHFMFMAAISLSTRISHITRNNLLAFRDLNNSRLISLIYKLRYYVISYLFPVHMFSFRRPPACISDFQLHRTILAIMPSKWDPKTWSQKEDKDLYLTVIGSFEWSTYFALPDKHISSPCWCWKRRWKQEFTFHDVETNFFDEINCRACYH